jgi:hypothetical protein
MSALRLLLPVSWGAWTSGAPRWTSRSKLASTSVVHTTSDSAGLPGDACTPWTRSAASDVLRASVKPAELQLHVLGVTGCRRSKRLFEPQMVAIEDEAGLELVHIEVDKWRREHRPTLRSLMAAHRRVLDLAGDRTSGSLQGSLRVRIRRLRANMVNARRVLAHDGRGLRHRGDEPQVAAGSREP